MADFDNRIGAEEIQLAVYKILFQRINEYIAIEEAFFDQIDQELQNLSGRGHIPVVLELFDPEYIHYGHRPSMIDAPVEEYPSMSVMTSNVRTGPENASIDMGEQLLISCAIEVIVKSGPYRQDDRDGIGEDLVGRRIKRTAEAVYSIINDNRYRLGVQPPIGGPTVEWGDIFAVTENERSNRYYWQGVRIVYRFPKEVSF